MPGTIYLIPNTLGNDDIATGFPAYNLEIIRSIKHFAVEGEKSARKFLKSCGVMPPFEGIQFYLLDKRTPAREISLILEGIGEESLGILSEAGCPGIADPGSNLVLAAHNAGNPVAPLIGPSSILLALMASGMNGQGFTFHGYLPVNSGERMQRLRELESESARTGYTQLFIETPFRNESLFSDAVKVCRQNTMLCIACDLTLPSQEIKTMSIDRWRKNSIPLRNRQVVFCLQAQFRRPKFDKKE